MCKDILIFSAMKSTDLCPDEHFLPLKSKPVFSDPFGGNSFCFKQSSVLHAVNLLQGVLHGVGQGLLAVFGIQNLKLDNNCIFSATI